MGAILIHGTNAQHTHVLWIGRHNVALFSLKLKNASLKVILCVCVYLGVFDPISCFIVVEPIWQRHAMFSWNKVVLLIFVQFFFFLS